MSFEEDVSKFNEFYFFREFTFSETTFRKSPSEEVELADNIVWIEKPLIVYQLKERQASDDTTPEKEQKWFKRKIIDSAKRQICDTLNYLRNHKNIRIQNHRGHEFNIETSSLDSIHRLVLYKAHESLPDACKELKHYKSKAAGFIHLISSENYSGIVKTLQTPAEVTDYLSFREMLISNWEEDTLKLPEQAMVGQYLSGSSQSIPSIDFIDYLQKLDHKSEEWNMSGIINVFPDRITSENFPTDYYSIVGEIAKLKRNELREFKTRFVLSMEKAEKNELVLPYRIAFTRTGCGFVFISLAGKFLESRLKLLENLTHAHKYDQKLPKCIGVSFAFEEDGWHLVDWCYIESLWEYDEELENQLQQSNPFREVQAKEIPKYTFETEG